MFLQLMLWYLTRLSVVAITFTIMSHPVHATEQLTVSLMYSNTQNAFPPHCESVGGMLDAIHHGHGACLPKKTPIWFNFSSPAFILPEILAQTNPWYFTALVKSTAPTTACSFNETKIPTSRNHHQQNKTKIFPPPKDPRNPHQQYSSFHPLTTNKRPKPQIDFSVTATSTVDFLNNCFINSSHPTISQTIISLQIIHQTQHPFQFSPIDHPSSTMNSQNSRTPKATKALNTRGHRPTSQPKNQSLPRQPKPPTVFTPTTKRVSYFTQNTPPPLPVPFVDRSELVPFLTDNETHTTLFPASLFQCLRDRLFQEHPPKSSVILQGLAHTGDATTNIFTMESIFERLHLLGITLDAADIQSGGVILDAVRKQTADNGRAHGVLGSSNKGISLSLNLATPGTSGETMFGSSRYPTSMHCNMLINKRDAAKRIYDISVRFSITFQTIPRCEDMRNHVIQSIDSLDPNWRMLFTATWLHKDLNVKSTSIIIDLDQVFRQVLSDTEYQYFIENIIVAPVKPYITDEDGPVNSLQGGGVSYHLRTDLDDPLQMTTRRKVLHHLMGAYNSSTGNGMLNGIGMVYYQPPSEDQPLLLSTSTIRQELLTPTIWLVRFSNLPQAISPYHMLILLLEGYHFNPADILNIVMDLDQLNDNQIHIADRTKPSMLILLASPEVLRTFLVHSALILADLQQQYQNAPETRQALIDDPTNQIILSSPHKNSTTLPRLPSDGLYRHLSPLSLSAEAIHQRVQAGHDPTNGLASERAPWATPPSQKHRPPFTPTPSTTPHVQTSSRQERPLPSSSLFHSPSSSSSRSESPKRARDGSTVTQVQSLQSLTLSPPTTPISPPLTQPSSIFALGYTLRSLRQRAFDDQTGATGRDILMWAHTLAKTLRDANLLPDADTWTIVGPTHDQPTPPEGTTDHPMYNITLPEPTSSSQSHTQKAGSSIPLAPRPPLPILLGQIPPPPGLTLMTTLRTAPMSDPLQSPPSTSPSSTTATRSSDTTLDFHQVDDSMDTEHELEEGEVDEGY